MTFNAVAMTWRQSQLNSGRLFIRDVARKCIACGRTSSSANKDSCSIRVHQREGIDKCIYTPMTEISCAIAQAECLLIFFCPDDKFKAAS